MYNPPLGLDETTGLVEITRPDETTVFVPLSWDDYYGNNNNVARWWAPSESYLTELGEYTMESGEVAGYQITGLPETQEISNCPQTNP